MSPVLIASSLLTGGDRAEVVRDLVAGLRGRDPDSALRAYFASFFGRYDDAATKSWILDQAVLDRAARNGLDLGGGSCQLGRRIGLCASAGYHFSTSTRALRTPICCAPLSYARGLMIARTIGSGHFSPLVVPEQVNAVLERFLRLHVANEMSIDEPDEGAGLRS
jgi:hypothetical protein